MKAVSQLNINEVLGERYRILAVLGHGGMSTVYLAEDLKLKGKKWAVKQSYYPSHDVLKFIKEAEILIKLNHSNLPHIVDYFPPVDGQSSFLVMDYIKGCTLSEIFNQLGRKLSWQKVVKYSVQLCDLFIYLHNYKPSPIIYRDLKPSNVMIDEQDCVRLIDFGIARNFEPVKTMDTIEIGTVGFAAPEQFEHKQTDQRTDLYILGALMYYLLSNGSFYRLVPNPWDLVERQVPLPLLPILQKLLRTDPAERYQNASALKQDLEQIELVQTNLSSSRKDPPMAANKLILIGSLYAGAGSTFVTLAAAKALNHYGFPHAVVELPVNEPELYSLLYGEKHVPKDYVYLPASVMSGRTNLVEWRNKHTTWYPTNPGGLEEGWNPSSTLKLLYALKHTTVLLDISNHWEDGGIQEVLESADEIIIVVDPMISKLNRPQSNKILKKLFALRRSKESINIVVNRTPGMKFFREADHLLPKSPLFSLPNFPYSDVVDSVWKGELIQERPEILNSILAAIRPLLSRIAPSSFLGDIQQNKMDGMIRRIFKNIS